MEVILIVVIVFIVEIFYNPRLGFTRENKILLWYGKRKRKYIVIF